MPKFPWKREASEAKPAKVKQAEVKHFPCGIKVLKEPKPAIVEYITSYCSVFGVDDCFSGTVSSSFMA
jgi:hypothetical protein